MEKCCTPYIYTVRVCGVYLASDLLLRFELLFWHLAALHICGSQSSLHRVLSLSTWIWSQLSSQSPELLPLMAKLPRATFFTNINMQNLIEVCGAVPLTTAEIFTFCAHFAYLCRWNAKAEVFLQETKRYVLRLFFRDHGLILCIVHSSWWHGGLSNK